MAKICIIDSNKIENGGSLMYENTDLINWNSDLTKLTTSDAMFSGCESLVSFTGNLDNLTTAGFKPFTNIEYDGVTEEIINKVDTSTSGMFHDCSSLTIFNSTLPLLKNGCRMFYGTGLTSWNIDLPNLEDGIGMFENSQLSSFSGDLSSLIYGGQHGDYYYSETISDDYDEDGYLYTVSWIEEEDISSGMFQNTSLTSWNIDLPNLQDGYNMFKNCRALTSFSGDLSSLWRAGYSDTSGDYGYETVDGMFMNCINLNSFSSDINSVNECDGMFLNCFSLSNIENNPSFDNIFLGNLMFSGTKIENINLNLTPVSTSDAMFLSCPYITDFSLSGDIYDWWSGASMFGFNLLQLSELCGHNNITFADLPVVTNGQRFYLNEITSLPIYCTMMFGIMPYTNLYFSRDGITQRLPLPSEINGDLYWNLGYEIDKFNPTLTLFCDDINTLISNNGYEMEISFLVHGRHLKGSQEDGGNTIEILSAMASTTTFSFLQSLGIVTATEEAINEFISNGWEIVSEDDEIYLGIINDFFIEFSSNNYPNAIGLKIYNENMEYMYITVLHNTTLNV